MSLPSDADQLRLVPAPVDVSDKSINRHFSVYRKGFDLYESEYELDAAGKKVFEQEHRLAYAVGAGEAGYTYLVQRGNYLFQAPLSFFSKTQSWELSPGYEVRDQGFSRPIFMQCIVCHAGRPSPAQGAQQPSSPFYTDPFEGADPPFAELAIGCENCHGPGELHVKERLAGAPLSDTTDTSIVNPSRLSPALANEICMPCHQAGDARVFKPGKTMFDFRPGTPLDNTLALFQVPLNPGSPTPSPLLGHYFGMTLSECYAKSGGRLGCITCHNPHEQLTGAPASAYFRSKCLTCHTEKSCTFPLQSRLHGQPPDNCVRCHMPKQNLTAVSHAALTDHRITARPNEGYPDWAFRLATPGLPDLIHIDALPGPQGRPPAIILFDAYTQLAASHPDVYLSRYLASLQEVEVQNSDNPFVLSALAQRGLGQHQADGREQAIHYLSRAIDLGSKYPVDYLRLGELLAQTSATSQSISVLRRGLLLAPFDASFYGTLASDYLSSGDRSAAVGILRRGLDELPEDNDLRAFLEKITSASQNP
ncbi:MAG TPA: hypothetical protein VG206_14865 [Terriglobia bacterium]|nr:hypothetical protein [Terriglobia bacterium]